MGEGSNGALKQIMQKPLFWDDPCPDCGKRAQMAICNFDFTPSKILSSDSTGSKVSGTMIGRDGFKMCFACGRRSEVVPVGGRWEEKPAPSPASGGQATDAPDNLIDLGTNVTPTG